MKTAVIITKTDPKVKKQAQKVASELGFSLSSLVNAYLKNLIKTKTVNFSAVDERPSPYLIRAIKQAEKDLKAGKVSPAFDSADDAITWLDNPNARYENGDKV